MNIQILGTEYEISEENKKTSKTLDECDGYCDNTSKVIVVLSSDSETDLDNFEEYRKKVKRHEIIHAFLFESGLHGNWAHDIGHDETYVDWIAAQFLKLYAAFKAADAL